MKYSIIAAVFLSFAINLTAEAQQREPRRDQVPSGDRIERDRPSLGSNEQPPQGSQAASLPIWINGPDGVWDALFGDFRTEACRFMELTITRYKPVICPLDPSAVFNATETCELTADSMNPGEFPSCNLVEQNCVSDEEDILRFSCPKPGMTVELPDEDDEDNESPPG